MKRPALEGWRDPDSGALAALDGAPPVLRGPTLGSGGLYSFEIEVVSAGGFLPAPEGRKAHAADVSVAESRVHEHEGLEGTEAVFVTRSYFDTVSGLDYDPRGGRAGVFNAV